MIIMPVEGIVLPPKLYGLRTVGKPLPLDVIVPLLQQSRQLRSFIIDGITYVVNVGSKRLACFKRSQCCVTCKHVGAIFVMQQHHIDVNPHINLYAVGPNGGLTLMTRDHIVPVSKGGLDSMENMQTMCWPCNQRKGDAHDGITIPQQVA